MNDAVLHYNEMTACYYSAICTERCMSHALSHNANMTTPCCMHLASWQANPQPYIFPPPLHAQHTHDGLMSANFVERYGNLAFVDCIYQMWYFPWLTNSMSCFLNETWHRVAYSCSLTITISTVWQAKWLCPCAAVVPCIGIKASRTLWQTFLHDALPNSVGATVS